jgi:hypothetical protein
MKLQRVLLSAGLCFSGSAQTPDAAPKEVEDALRARIDQFFQASVSGKFRQALPLVAEDSIDKFLQDGANKHDSCETTKITFSDGFTKADVIEKCKGVLRFHGVEQHPSIPVTSRWKVIDGQWFWYWAEGTEVRTPFGVSKVDSNAKTAGAVPTLPDGKKLASGIFESIKIDRKSVNLSVSKVSQDAITVTNGLPGGISLSLPTPTQPGLSITSGKTDLGAGEGTQIVFKYDVNDPAIACMSCTKKIRGPVMAEIRILPTGQVFPIAINFTSDDEK